MENKLEPFQFLENLRNQMNEQKIFCVPVWRVLLFLFLLPLASIAVPDWPWADVVTPTVTDNKRVGYHVKTEEVNEVQCCNFYYLRSMLPKDDRASKRIIAATTTVGSCIKMDNISQNQGCIAVISLVEVDN